MQTFRHHLDVVSEAFDRPYRFAGSHPNRLKYEYYFKTDDGSTIHLEAKGNEWAEDDITWNIRFSRNGKMDATGEGDAQRIFATVIAIIKDFVKKENPREFKFSAMKPEGKRKDAGSRGKLYSRMVKRFASKMGYKSFEISGQYDTEYRLEKK